jgi:large subunit ribosomal protein L13
VNKATAQKKWVVVDATDQVMGRLCSKVAKILRGKYKPSFTPNVDCGDNVIIINAEKVTMTGNKWTEREWLTFTGYPSGQRVHTAASVTAKNGYAALFQIVLKGMLPKNKLGAQLLKNVRVNEGSEYKEVAQQPEVIDINTLK